MKIKGSPKKNIDQPQYQARNASRRRREQLGLYQRVYIESDSDSNEEGENNEEDKNVEEEGDRHVPQGTIKFCFIHLVSLISILQNTNFTSCLKIPLMVSGQFKQFYIVKVTLIKQS